MELVGGIAFIIWINDKFPPQFGHMVAFKGNEYPHTSHLVLFDFSVVILALLPLRLPGTAEQHIAFPEWIFGKQMPNPFPGNATPILFNNRQQNQSNKIVVRKLPPGAFETKKRCCPSVGLSYRIFQIAAKSIYNHLTNMELANWKSTRNLGPNSGNVGGKD